MKNNITNEDRALDQLLDMAPAPPASPMLANQILSIAKGQEIQSPASNVIDFVQPKKTRKKPYLKADNWLIGGLMAASLVIGIWSGTNDFADILVTAPLELAGIEQPSEFNLYNILDGFSAAESLL